MKCLLCRIHSLDTKTYLCVPYRTVPTNRYGHGVKAHLENPFHDEWAVVPGVRAWTLVDKGAVLLGQGEVF
jgi:hypothetical protein